ncbi:putative drug export protein [Microbacterium sp. TS-1]|nr:putative drug export protein [Microbacterium sp. TS-1]
MTDEESIRVASEAARRNVRGSLGSRSFHPRDAEMLVFDAAGQRAHAVEIWHAARAIGEEGNKSARAELRRRYGGRAPGVGWIGWVLVLAAICAALALVMSTGFRVPAKNLEGVVVALSVAAAVLIAVTLVGAAALTLGRGAVVGGAIVASAALVALAALATVQDRAADLQRQTADRLGPELAAAIVRIRTAAFAEAPVSPHGLDLARYDDAVPAGGVIISDFADPRVWLPRALADKL